MRIICGIICFCLGVILRRLAICKLGKDFKLTLETPSRIVTIGIYRYMRHPSYFGSLLIILGLSLIEPTLGIMAISFAFFLSRIVNEERILNSDKYQDYKQKTGMFFPKKIKDGGTYIMINSGVMVSDGAVMGFLDDIVLPIPSATGTNGEYTGVAIPTSAKFLAHPTGEGVGPMIIVFSGGKAYPVCVLSD